MKPSFALPPDEKVYSCPRCGAAVVVSATEAPPLARHEPLLEAIRHPRCSAPAQGRYDGMLGGRIYVEPISNVTVWCVQGGTRRMTCDGRPLAVETQHRS